MTPRGHTEGQGQGQRDPEPAGRRLCLAAFLGSSLCTAVLLLKGACGGSLGPGQEEFCSLIPVSFQWKKDHSLIAAHCAEPEHGGVWSCAGDALEVVNPALEGAVCEVRDAGASFFTRGIPGVCAEGGRFLIFPFLPDEKS